MGGFLTIAGTANTKLPDLEAALRSYAVAEGGKFTRAPKGIDTGAAVITSGDAGRLSLLCPAGYQKCDKLAAFLSKKLKTPVFLFHIHDGDFWMYWLFAAGKEVD